MKPRAMHHTRWMPFILYPPKIFVYSAQSGYDKDFISKLEAICKFNALLYVKNWFPSSIGTDTPYNGLNLWNEYKKYCRHGPLVFKCSHKSHGKALLVLSRRMRSVLSIFEQFFLFSSSLPEHSFEFHHAKILKAKGAIQLFLFFSTLPNYHLLFGLNLGSCFTCLELVTTG